ncbi:dephospho-CoA kinase [Psychrobacter arenosus]|nr:dephospho-CoA kinase [Psychrobacter arenosus]
MMPLSTTDSILPQTFSTKNTRTKLPFIVGLTGGIGSGKSAASDWFAAQGIEIIDADVIAHQIVAKGQPALEQIKEKFGDWVLTAEGEMDRAAMRAHVFAHPNALIDLEDITHPAVREHAKQALQTATSPYVILSAPLLLESAEAGLAKLCQRVLVIDVNEDLQLARAGARDQQSHDKIKAIMANQLSRHDRVAQADDVIINEADLDALYAKLQPLHEQYLQLASTYR